MTMQANEQAPAAGLDVPDGPGWWARDGSDLGQVGGVRQFASHFVRWEIRDDEVLFQWGDGEKLAALPVDEFKRIFGGKWYRLHMPWETAPAQPQPAETWRPMPDGTRQWSEQEGLIVRGKQLEVLVRPRVNGRLLGIESVEVTLPDDLALCQRATQPHSAGVPEPVRHVLTVAMDNLRNDVAFEAIHLSPYILQNMETAFKWLQSQRPGTQGEGD